MNFFVINLVLIVDSVNVNGVTENIRPPQSTPTQFGLTSILPEGEGGRRISLPIDISLFDSLKIKISF